MYATVIDLSGIGQILTGLAALGALGASLRSNRQTKKNRNSIDTLADRVDQHSGEDVSEAFRQMAEATLEYLRDKRSTWNDHESSGDWEQ